MFRFFCICYYLMLLLLFYVYICFCIYMYLCWWLRFIFVTMYVFIFSSVFICICAGDGQSLWNVPALQSTPDPLHYKIQNRIYSYKIRFFTMYKYKISIQSASFQNYKIQNQLNPRMHTAMRPLQKQMHTQTYNLSSSIDQSLSPKICKWIW